MPGNNGRITNREILREIVELREDQKALNHVILGDGEPEKGMYFRIAMLENTQKDIQAKADAIDKKIEGSLSVISNRINGKPFLGIEAKLLDKGWKIFVRIMGPATIGGILYLINLLENLPK
jgi:hypothetical protein